MATTINSKSSCGSRKFRNVDEYIRSFDGEARTGLERLRELLRSAAPAAEEVISYNMPALRMGKNLLYFAAHNKHIGIYPHGESIRVFKKELGDYNTSRGTIQLPYGEKWPLALLKKIVRFRMKEVLEKEKLKGKKT